ncbi:hypothetical protein [Actinocorallia aurantiaca]
MVGSTPNGEQFSYPEDLGSENAEMEFSPSVDPMAMSAIQGVSSAVIDAKEGIAEAIQRGVRDRRPGPMATEDLQGAGNIQGVAIGRGGAGGSVPPGSPALTVYVAESTGPDELRSVIVDAMRVRAAADLPIAVVRSGVIRPLSNTARLRPAPCGYSAGHTDDTTGTIGFLATGMSAPRDSRLLSVSNNHVYANSNDAKAGDCLCQPGYVDGGSCPDDKMALLERFVPLKYDGSPNHVDCATGWCLQGTATPELAYHTNTGVTYFRINSQPKDAVQGTIVGKTGRTTQLTEGIVQALGWSGTINYDSHGPAFFTGQIVVEKMGDRDFSQRGDSGSVIWTWDSHLNPVGLLFAGGIGVTFANPISWVLQALDIRPIT